MGEPTRAPSLAEEARQASEILRGCQSWAHAYQYAEPVESVFLKTAALLDRLAEAVEEAPTDAELQMAILRMKAWAVDAHVGESDRTAQRRSDAWLVCIAAERNRGTPTDQP